MTLEAIIMALSKTPTVLLVLLPTALAMLWQLAIFIQTPPEYLIEEVREELFKLRNLQNDTPQLHPFDPTRGPIVIGKS